MKRTTLVATPVIASILLLFVVYLLMSAQAPTGHAGTDRVNQSAVADRTANDHLPLVFSHGGSTLVLDDLFLGSSSRRSFRVTNEGDAAISVAQVTSSCGCTSADLSAQTIPAGQSVELLVKLDVPKIPDYNFESSVIVQSQQGQVALLNLTGRAKTPFLLNGSSAAVDLGVVSEGGMASGAVIILQSLLPEILSLLNVDDIEAVAEHSLVISKLPPLNGSPAFQILSPHQLAAGAYTVPIIIKPRSSESLVFERDVVFQVSGPLEVKPDEIYVSGTPREIGAARFPLRIEARSGDLSDALEVSIASHSFQDLEGEPFLRPVLGEQKLIEGNILVDMQLVVDDDAAAARRSGSIDLKVSLSSQVYRLKVGATVVVRRSPEEVEPPAKASNPLSDLNVAEERRGGVVSVDLSKRELLVQMNGDGGRTTLLQIPPAARILIDDKISSLDRIQPHHRIRMDYDAAGRLVQVSFKFLVLPNGRVVERPLGEAF